MEELFQVLADTLGYSIEAIKDNAPAFIEEYGRYTLVKCTWTNIFIGLILGAVISMIVILLLKLFLDECTDWYFEDYGKWLILVSVSVFIIVLVVSGCYEYFIYKASPLMYSLNHLKHLLP